MRKTLKSSGFKFKDNYARIIKGQEEGMSAWVTVNYLRGSLMFTKVTISYHLDAFKIFNKIIVIFSTLNVIG